MNEFKPDSDFIEVRLKWVVENPRWGLFPLARAAWAANKYFLPGVMFQNLGGIGGAAASASLPGPMGPTGAASKLSPFIILH